MNKWTGLLCMLLIVSAMTGCGTSANNAADNTQGSDQTATNSNAGSSNSASNASSTDSTDSTDSSNSSASSDDASKEPVTIKFLSNPGELSDDLIKSFNDAHPNIKLERVEADANKLAAMIASGDAPDIIRVIGATELASDVLKGLALDLTPYFDKSALLKPDDFLPVANLYRFDGKTIGQGPIYGFPKDWSPDFTIFYNKKLFDAAGVPLPSMTEPMTWPQLIDLSKKLTKKDGDKIVQYGLTTLGKTEPTLDKLLIQMASEDKPVFSNDFSSADFSTPEVKSAIQMWIDAVKANVGNNQVNQDPAGWGGELFANEKSAMQLSGYWFSGVIRSTEGMKAHLDDFGMMPAPISEGGKRVSPTATATGAIISKSSKHPQEAWEVFEWYFGGQPAQDRAKSGWGVPALKSMVNLLPQETDFDKRTYASLQDELKYSDQFLKFNPYLLNGDAVFNKDLMETYFDKKSVDDALKDLTTDVNKLIEEGKSIAGQ